MPARGIHRRVVPAGGETADRDAIRIDQPFFFVLANQPHRHANFTHRGGVHVPFPDRQGLGQIGKDTALTIGGIAQYKGVVAHGGKAQGDRLRLPVRAVKVAAAGADQDGRAFLPRKKIRGILQYRSLTIHRHGCHTAKGFVFHAVPRLFL